jgi:histidine phosphotransfer protein HptB
MQPTSNVQSQDTLPLIDQRAMNDWSGDLDQDDVVAILARVPEELRTNMAAIEKAVAAGGLPAAKRSAHRLKGMAGNLGAARLAQVAREIEVASESIGDVALRLDTLRQTITETLAALAKR